MILVYAVVRIHLLGRSITFWITGNTIWNDLKKFLTPRHCAGSPDITHFVFLPYFAMMEQEKLVTRAERVGILTTVKGRRKMTDLMQEKYRQETDEIPGQVVLMGY